MIAKGQLNAQANLPNSNKHRKLTKPYSLMNTCSHTHSRSSIVSIWDSVIMYVESAWGKYLKMT